MKPTRGLENAAISFEIEDHGMKVVRRPLELQVFEAMREAIATGALAPGERIVETALAERFKVSRGTVRSALGGWRKKN